MADFNPDDWLAETAPQQPDQDGFDPDQWLQESDGFLAKYGRSAKESLKEFPGMARGLADTLNKVNPMMQPARAIQSGYEMYQGKPFMETPTGESAKATYGLAKDFVGGAWQGVKDTLSAGKAPFEMLIDDELPFEETEIGQKLLERPFSVPLGIVGTLSGARAGYKGLKARGYFPKKVPPIEGTPNVFDTAPEGVPPTAKGVPPPEPGTPPPPPPPGAGAKSTRPPVHEQLQEVADYLSEKMAPVMQTKGIRQNLGRAMEEKGLGMTIGELGGPPGMTRKLRDAYGETFVKDLAKRAQDKGVTKGFFNFQTGDAIQNMMDVSGKQLGAFRTIAARRGAVHNMENLLGHLEQKLGPEFRSGVGSASTELDNVLESIRQTPPDVASMAKKVTDTYKQITGNKLIPPAGATRRVLAEVNKMNNELIAKYLNPKELPIYQENLIDNAASHIYHKMHGFQFGRTFGGRTGPAGIWNTIKDIGGRKILEKVYTNVGRGLQTKPYQPGMLTADVLQAVDEALTEMIQQAGLTQ